MREKPDCAGQYYAFYRCPVNFSASENSLILPTELMDKPLPSRNQHLARMHDQVLQNYLGQLSQSELGHKVREITINLMPSGEVCKEQIADSLHMSSRTLHRKLQEEGTSFAEILNDTRRELAIQYIQDNNLPLIEVSYLLGFSDSSAFTRAFKRWTGKTPAHARAEH
jgi:AraC-like DNA-binding protein